MAFWPRWRPVCRGFGAGWRATGGTTCSPPFGRFWYRWAHRGAVRRSWAGKASCS